MTTRTGASALPSVHRLASRSRTTAVVRDLLASRWTDGKADAPVRVVMISDYQCPDCRTYELDIQSVLSKRDDVSLSVKHFPMCADCNPNVSRTMHANACWAQHAFACIVRDTFGLQSAHIGKCLTESETSSRLERTDWISSSYVRQSGHW